MDPRARKIVSYADITPSTTDEPETSYASTTALRPAKRARTSDPPLPSSKTDGAHTTPTSFTGKATNGNPHPLPQAKKQKRDPKNWQTSRTLTHEEIWDDSALIDAWDSAMEEYRAINGEGKGWMEDPEKKSALWWNTQPEPEEEEYADEDEPYEGGEVEDGEEGQEEEYASLEIEEFDVSLHAPQPTQPILPSSSAHPPTLGQAGAAAALLPTPLAALATDGHLAGLSDESNQLLHLAFESYGRALYYMGRRDEMLRRPTAAQPQQSANISKELDGKGEEMDQTE